MLLRTRLKQLFYCLLLFNSSVSAAPSGTDLLTACQYSLKNGFDSTQGMLCIWYVTPCDCHFGKAMQVPRVCLPDNVEHDVLAQDIVNALQAKPELQSETAEMAAALILAPDYPCLD